MRLCGELREGGVLAGPQAPLCHACPTSGCLGPTCPTTTLPVLCPDNSRPLVPRPHPRLRSGGHLLRSSRNLGISAPSLGSVLGGGLVLGSRGPAAPAGASLGPEGVQTLTLQVPVLLAKPLNSSAPAPPTPTRNIHPWYTPRLPICPQEVISEGCFPRPPATRAPGTVPHSLLSTPPLPLGRTAHHATILLSRTSPSWPSLKPCRENSWDSVSHSPFCSSAQPFRPTARRAGRALSSHWAKHGHSHIASYLTNSPQTYLHQSLQEPVDDRAVGPVPGT